MAKRWLRGISTVGVIGLLAGSAGAEDISAKKLLIKDPAANPAKRQVILLSKDPGIQLSEVDDPAATGATIHLYSATDDYCALLPSGPDWQNLGTKFKYKNKVTKNTAQVQDGKILIGLRSSVAYTLADDGTQGTVNVQVQFGATGTRYCMRCSGNKKDEAAKFLAKDCVAAACDAEPSGACDPTPPGVELQGALPATTGRFNYNLTLGVPGANAACNTNFPGTHACTYSELQAAEAAGDLDGLKDTTNATVTSFWAIDPTRPDDDQCAVTIDWDYQTAHTGQFADKVTLNNPAGTLGALQTGQLCLQSGWVGCCL
jgi:hypothetical protein